MKTWEEHSGGTLLKIFFMYINLKKETEYLEMSQSEKREKNRSFGKFIKNSKKKLKKSGHKYF